MVDREGLILVAHSDSRALLAIYTLLDGEGYFVAPCFSEADLLRYCSRYKPELILTDMVLSGPAESRLLEQIRERSPGTRVVLLPEVLTHGAATSHRPAWLN